MSRHWIENTISFIMTLCLNACTTYLNLFMRGIDLTSLYDANGHAIYWI